MSDTFDMPIHDDNQGTNSAFSAGNRADASASRDERRIRRRAMISAPVRVRSLGLAYGGPDEISTTLDVSRGGLLFVSSGPVFVRGMVVAVTFPYTKAQGAIQAEQEGRVVRCAQLPDGRFSVAIALGVGGVEKFVSSSVQMIEEKAPEKACVPERSAERPMILVVDGDPRVRKLMKSLLTAEGYEVIALATAGEAHEVLNMFMPALLIAEIEGADMPGYELCAYVKTTHRLQNIPVMLMTSSAYPSDYSSAHALGAVVCMAKPFRQERLTHVVRLLAPTPQAVEQTAPARTADTKQKHCGTRTGSPSANDSLRKRLRPSW